MVANRQHGNIRNMLVRLHRAFKNDFWRKIIAIACAVLVYYAISYQRDNNDPIRVPVEIISPESYINMSPKQYVYLKLSGNRFFLRDLNRLSRIRAIVKVPEHIESHNIHEFPVKIDVSNIEGLPKFGVGVNSIEPNTLSINLDRRVSKDLKIVANYNQDGELSAEYSVTNVTIEPPTVKVSGPENILKDVTAISTEKIPLSGVSESFEYQVFLRKPEYLSFDSLAQNSVRALVEISRQYENRLMKAVAVRVLKMPDKEIKVELNNPYVDVVLKGSKDKLAMLKNSSLCPYIDISSLEESGVYSAEVYCWVDDIFTKVNEIHPPKIQIKLTVLDKK